MKNLIFSIMPLIVLAGSSLVILLVLAVKRNHLLINILTASALIISIYSAFKAPVSNSIMFAVDGFGILVIVILLIISFIITVFSYSYFENQNVNKEEYYILLLTGTLGGCSLVLSSNFISFFLSLELLSISVFVLTGYLREANNSSEASVKYLILSGVSSSFLLMGMAFIYTKTGYLDFEGISKQLSTIDKSDFILLGGTGFMLAGTGFKMGVVPFHLWTPDVYEGAPSPSTSFIASISKGAIVVIWMKFFFALNGYQYASIMFAMTAIAALSIIFGNLLALLQKNIKRLLAYSSIANLGYILIGIISGGNRGAEAVIFYVATYAITVVGAFAIISLFSGKERDALYIQDFKGLFWQKPLLSAVFITILLSLAGLPLTAGFIAKFYIALAGVVSGNIFLVIILVIGSAIGLYYYLRIIVEMLKKPEEYTETKPYISNFNMVVLSVLFLIIILIGIFPSEIVDLILKVSVY